MKPLRHHTRTRKTNRPEPVDGLVKAGWYTARIANAQLCHTDDDFGVYIKMRYDVTGSKYQGCAVFSNLNIKNRNPKIEEIGRNQLGKVMSATGLRHVQDTDDLIGNQLQIKVTICTDTSGQCAPHNDVEDFKPIGASVAHRSAATPKRPHTRTRKTATPVPVSEHVEQREFVSEFRKAFPQVRIYAVPNGGARSRTAGARLKAEGVSPGVPDLHIPEWRLWIEMKRAKGGRVSPEQADWHAYLRGIGDTVIVARGQHDAWRQIDDLLTKEMGDER